MSKEIGVSIVFYNFYFIINLSFIIIQIKSPIKKKNSMSNQDHDHLALIQRLKMNKVLGLRTQLDSEQMKIIKDHKLQNEGFMKNVKEMNIRTRE